VANDGFINVKVGRVDMPLRSGEAFLVPQGMGYTIESKGPSVLYKASIPPIMFGKLSLTTS
jgi:hypothetical protein